MYSHPISQPCVMTIAGTGSYVPERVLSNADLESLVDTTDEWITSRTGIKERRIAAPGQATSDMATKAAENALECAGITAQELDLIIVATISPDTFFPATACYVQRNLGAVNAVAFDLSAAGLCVKPLDVALFADRERGIDEDLNKVLCTYQFSCHFALLAER